MLNPNRIIEEIIKRGIDWYDYTKLDEARWREYANDAKFIASSPTFLNEFNHYITDLIKFIAYESENYDQVLHTRTAIVALETLKQRLEGINPPPEHPSHERLHEPI